MDFVTQEQCEERRKEIDNKHGASYEKQVAMMVEIAGMRADFRNFSFTMKWVGGIIAGLLVSVGGGCLMWMITK